MIRVARKKETHFALWRHGILLTSTAAGYEAALRDLESRHGPAWIKGVCRYPGEPYQPLP